LEKGNSETGTAIVEITLVLMMLMLIISALIDLGFLMNTRLVLVAAAREGARRAAVDGGASDSAFQTTEEQLALGQLDPHQADIEIRPKQAIYGTPITVTVRSCYEIMTPFVRAIAGQSIPLQVEVVCRSEKVP
jgi:Flp pilus assembly protein TadG